MNNEQIKELQDNFTQAVTGHPVVIDEQIAYRCSSCSSDRMETCTCRDNG